MSTIKTKWLLPVDGSDASTHAVEVAIDEARQLPKGAEILLLNVQPMLSKDISRFINAESLEDFHQENGNLAMADAVQRLDASGLPYTRQIILGETAATISEVAVTQGCTRIVMGARGLGSVVGLLMGSVTTKVVHLAQVPVLLVK